MEVGLRPTGKPVDMPPNPTAAAPRFYSTNYSFLDVVRLAPQASVVGDLFANTVVIHGDRGTINLQKKIMGLKTRSIPNLDVAHETNRHKA